MINTLRAYEEETYLMLSSGFDSRGLFIRAHGIVPHPEFTYIFHIHYRMKGLRFIKPLAKTKSCMLGV